MTVEEVRTAQEYDRWLRRPGLAGAGMRLLMSPAGQFLINTPAFRLPEELVIRPEHRLLDIGCGRAALLRILATRVRFTTPPVGLDTSKTVLRLAQRDILRSEEYPIGLIRGAATGLPFAADSFDFVISAHMVKHLSDRALRQCFQEIYRVLRPGGLALIWEFAPVRSRLINRWNRWLITRGVSTAHLRSYARLAAVAEEVGFDWFRNAQLRPFLYPPIPRVSILMGKAPAGWSSPATST